jgi:GntR family transcriptional repressor for pyruvate dehydrogenase complex
MAKATKNKVLLRITDNIMDLLSESRDRYLQVEGRPEKSMERHRQVLNAIKARDRRLAEQLMREHLMEIENSLFAAKRKEGDKRSQGREE